MIIKKKYLSPNKYSRSMKKLQNVKAVVVHWVANPETSAEFNWQYFEDKKEGKTGYGSIHFIVDLDGSILQIMEEDEVAYHVGSKNGPTTYARKILCKYPNNCTLGIEMTHQDWEGTFTDETFDAAVELCAHLCNKYGLNPFTQIITHKFVVGYKDCPLWFFLHPEDFLAFKVKIKELM